MDTVFGLIGMAIYMVIVVGLAAAITWLVVKLSPSKSQKQLDAQKTAES
ncbi:MAG: hypothetical protein ACR2GT_09050 [Gaiellaceae bacterium]